jgi:hypothetical protein
MSSAANESGKQFGESLIEQNFLKDRAGKPALFFEYKKF